MIKALVTRSSGHTDDHSFDGYEIVAAPLPGYSKSQREARVFRRPDGGTDYGSHTVAFATHKIFRQLYILVEHGGGREVWQVPAFYDGGEFERSLLAMPERLQYAALYTLYHMASEAYRQAESETQTKYNRAFVEGRLKKSRRKQGLVRVFIETGMGA